MRRSFLFSAAFVILSGCVFLDGQEPAGNQADAHNPSGPPGPMQSPSIWKVDPLTGALTIKIPVIAAASGGRGRHYGITLSYNSASTITLQYHDVNIGTVDYNWTPAGSSLTSFAPHGPWTTAGPFVVNNNITITDQTMYAYDSRGTQYTLGTYKGCSGWGPYLYTDADGGVHDLNVLIYHQPEPGSNNPLNPGCNQYASTGSYTSGAANFTIDSSALVTTVNSDNTVTAYEPDGTTFLQSSGALEDSNGNINNGVDSEGRSLIASESGTCATEYSPGGTCTYNVLDATGATRSYTVTTAQENLGSFTVPHPTDSEITTTTTYLGQANQIPNGGHVNPAVNSGYVMGVTSIGYPDGTSYSFQYDPTYAMVNKITFPTGGSVSFTWGIRNIGEGNAAASAESTFVVTDVYVSDGGGNTSHWNYSYPDYAAGQQYPLQSTEVDPDGTTVDHYSNAAFLYNTLFKTGTGTFQENFTDIYSASSAHMRSTSTVFNAFQPGLGHPYQVTTTYWDVSPAKQQCDQYFYDQWDNVIEKDESALYAYSTTPCNVPSGQWLRRTYTSYPTSFCSTTNANPTHTAPLSTSAMFLGVYPACAAGTPTNFDEAHIVNKPSQMLVTDGSNHPYSIVQYGYDEVAIVPSTSCSGSGAGCYNHDDTYYGQGRQIARGNLTSESHCAQINVGTTITPASNHVVSLSSGSSACAGGFLTTTYAYDLTGQRVSATDPALNTTSYSYQDPTTWSNGAPPGPTNSFLTQVIHPKSNLIDTYNYTWYTGQRRSHTDWNHRSTSYSYSDPFSRIRTITGPSVVDGTSGNSGNSYVEFDYSDTRYTGSGGFKVTTKTYVDANSTRTQTLNTVTYDGLARKILSSTITPECAAGIDVSTTYDSMSRVASVSNPYCAGTPGPTDGVTQFQYDALGRKVQTTLPDGAVSLVSYAGTATETTEPSNGFTNVTHVLQANGIGQLTDVCEVTSTSLGSGTPSACNLQISGSGYHTTYAYDPLGNLTNVNQFGLMRSFTYDALSRLLTSFNPEVGQETYAYNTSVSSVCGPEAPCTKTDARGVVTTYVYDPMGRVTGKSYSGSLVSDYSDCYQYDTKLSGGADSNPLGNLEVEWKQAGTCPVGTISSIPSGAVAIRIPASHDPSGQVLNERQCLSGTCTQSSGTGVFEYSYNLLEEPVQSNNGISTATAVAATQVAASTGNGTTMSAPSVTWKTVYDSANHIQSNVIQDQPAWSGSTIVWPATAFSQAPTILNAPVPAYDPFGHLVSAQLDTVPGSSPPTVTTFRSYDNRGRILLEEDNSQGATNPSSHSLGAVMIGGAEQPPTYPASSYAHATVTINGSEQDNQFNPCSPASCWQYIPDNGVVTVTVNGATVQVNYALNSTSSGIATLLAQGINTADSQVKATASGNVVTIRSTIPGTAGNNTAPLTANVVTQESQYYTSPSFNTSLSGSNLTGGTNVSQTTYDQGTVTVTVTKGGVNYTSSVSYNSSSTAQSIASALSSAINSSDSSFLSAQSDGDVSVLVSSVGGSATDYSVTGSVSFDSTDFNSGSFTVMASPLAEGDSSDSTDGLAYYYFVPNGGYAPNGNILVQSDMIMGDWFYSYDAVDRLTGATWDTVKPTKWSTTAANAHACWNWSYDAYGNRMSESYTATGCTGTLVPQVTNVSSPSNNNQFQNSTFSPNTVSGQGNIIYDASGNTLDDGNHEYWYDAEGRLCAVQALDTHRVRTGSITEYLYDPGGARIAKGYFTSTLAGYTMSGTIGVSPTCPQGVPGTNLTLQSRYLLDPGGNQVTELSESSGETWVHSNLFIGGKLTATYDTAGIHFPLTDPLGTKRVQLNHAGAVENSWTSLPFGNDVNNPLNYPSPDATEQHFTGKERDSESGNDYFEARYFSSAMGRFLSPDWSAKAEPVPYAKLDNPQTLNLYGYMQNNPIAGFDDNGHDALWVTDKASGQVTLVIPVHFTGSGATPERIQQIVDRDNSLNTNGSPVKIQVISTDKPVNGVLNTLDVSPGPDEKMCPGAGSCVKWAGADIGHIDSNDTGSNDSGPHEDLHFAGIQDEFVEGPKDAKGNRTSTPKPGYDKSNIMTSRSGTNLKPEQLQEASSNKTTKHCTTDNGKTTCE